MITSLKTSLCMAVIAGISQHALAQSEQDQSLAYQKMTIAAVVRNIEKGHFRPKPINDDFSQAIWKKYLLALDPNKNVFLQSDLEQLKKYEFSIDEELNGGSAEFFNAAYQLYQRRLQEISLLYKDILAKPFDLHKKESVQLNGTLLSFAKDRKELDQVWRKRLKYYLLKKMIDLEAERKATGASALVQGKGGKSDLLEKEARMKIRKWLDNSFKTLMSPSYIEEKFSQYLNTITFEMDPHTTYFAAVKARSVNEQMAKKYYGLGLELADKEGEVWVKSLRPGGVAIKSGLVDVNDRLLRITDRRGTMIDLDGVPITEVAELIRGDKDTEISLGLRKVNGIEKTISLKRGEIKEEEGRARSAVIHKGNQKIGYIYLPEFYADFNNPEGAHAAADIATELQQLKTAGVAGIVIDLRNNGGGSLDEVVKMSGYFLGSGPKVQVKGKEGVKAYATYDAPVYDGPLAVMINENSASASEIFAAVIQDYRRGIIIGSRSSYGKGTAQSTLPMGKMGDKAKGILPLNFGSLRLSLNQFYRVDGGSTQLKGVESDLILPGKLQYQKIREQDNETALSWDSIAPANYRVFNRTLIPNNVLALENEEIGKNEAFKVIAENSRLLAEHANDPLSLDLPKFKEQQAKMLSWSKKIDEAAQLPELKRMTITGTRLTSEGPGLEWYGKWMEGVSRDIYVDQTMKVMVRMMSNSDK